MKKNLLYLSIIIVCMISSCYYDNEEELYRAVPVDTTVVITYSGTIKTLIANTCATSTSCHSPGGPSLDFTQYATVNGNKDKIKTRINLSTSDPSYMPKGGALSGTDKSNFNRWLDAGALNN